MVLESRDGGGSFEASTPHVAGRRLRELLGLCPSWMWHDQSPHEFAWRGFSQIVKFLVLAAIPLLCNGPTKKGTCPQTYKQCKAAVVVS